MTQKYDPERLQTFEALDSAIIVPLVGGTFPTGQPAKLKLEPMTFLEWAALGRSIPVGTGGRGGGESEEMDPELAQQNLQYAKRVVCRAARQISAAYQDPETGAWSEVWLDVQLLMPGDAQPENPDVLAMPVEKLDRGWNILNAFNALAGDTASGGPMKKFDGVPFRP